MTPRGAGPSLPVEMIYRIVSLAVASYIDDLIVGPLAFRLQYFMPDAWEGVSVHIHEPRLSLLTTRLQDPAKRNPSPVLSFLVVSYQFRQITLNIISDALAIPLSNDEVWRCV